MHRRLILILLLAVSLSTYARSPKKDITLMAQPHSFSVLANRLVPRSLGVRILSILQGILLEENFEKKQELIKLFGLRYGEFLITPEGQNFLNEVESSIYIAIHKKLQRVYASQDPEKLQVIQAIMMETWPSSAMLDVDTARKYLLLSGIYESTPSRLWQTDPELMLRDFKILNKLDDLSVEQLAHKLFFEITTHTVEGSINLSALEQIGFRRILPIIRGAVFSENEELQTAVCNFFLKNVSIETKH